MTTKAPEFPSDFIWGTATAAYQIEGAATKDGRGPSIWDTFSHTPGNIANGDTGDVACDHYHRLEEDLDLIANLCPNYRFSISWTRILPDGTGEINRKGVDFYNRLIDGLLKRGVTPWVTIYHWDLPQALQDKGGWASREIIEWFGHYAETCVRLFGDRVRNWMIVNEPSVISYMGHALGVFAPGIKDETQYWACVHHLNMVVGDTFRRLKKIDSSLSIGSTYTPVPPRILDADAAQEGVPLQECFWHWNFFEPLFNGRYPALVQPRVAPHIRPGDEAVMKVDLDFIGLQHYSPIYFAPDSSRVLGFMFSGAPENLPRSDLGWVIDPDAFRDILLEMHRAYPGRKWLVTENGISLDDKIVDGKVDDSRRIDYLTQYLWAVDAARKGGMEIGGYFVWSLMDNYEWASGYGPRFGLIYIDYANNQARTPKNSYFWFKNLIEKA